MHPNSTWLVSYDTNRGSRLDKPENLWGLCDWRSFSGQNFTKIVKKQDLTSLKAKYM